MTLRRSYILDRPSMALNSVWRNILIFNGRVGLNHPIRCCSTLVSEGKDVDINRYLESVQSKKKRKDILQARKAIMKITRTDEHVEKAARNRQLNIPLDIVKKEWSTIKGMKEIAFLAKYYGIYRDILGGEEFKPLIWLDITFDSSSVHRGNILAPAKCLKRPAVHFTSVPDKYHTLMMLNPEGCWPCANAEVLHWMLINIPGSNTKEGKELAYIPPMPWKGSGFHRFCFVLFEQNGIINDDVINVNDINRFQFKTHHLLSNTNVLKPVGLSWFQSEWDESVTDTAIGAGIFEPKFEWQEITDPKQLRINKSREIRRNKYRIKFTNDDILL